jgi:flagellar hook-associated protein 3 FlgL
MRMTAATAYRDATASMEQASERLVDFQKQVESGKRIGKPSDDPTGTAVAIGERAEVAAVEQYTRTSDSVTSRLMVLDTALSDVVDRLTAAQVAVVGAQGSEKTAVQRESAAQTLEGIKQALVSDLNTSFRGAYLFAGADSVNPPFVVSGTTVSAYQGSSRDVDVDLDPTRSATIGLDGSAISKGSGAVDLFSTLDSAIAAARAGDETGLSQALTDLGAAFDRTSMVQMRVGANLASIEALQGQLSDRRLAGKARIAKIEDADLAEAVSGMNQAEQAYRASLAATTRIGQLSLMDYLK